MTQRKPEYKPLLFTTTVRNPARLKGLLWILKIFNGKILTNDLASKIVGETIRYGLYRPMKVNNSIKNKWTKSSKGEFATFILTDKEVDFVLKHNSQKHKEAGFDKGYPSRFATLFDFAKELGFVYFEIGSNIEFSEVGLKMAEIYSIDVVNGEILVEEKHPEYEQQAFLQAMCKYQRANPFVRVLNDNIPLILLLETIQKLNADKDFTSYGISRKELPLLIFWKDNNSNYLYQRIKKLRKDYGYNPSNEVIIDICINEIMQGFKQFKPKSIINEYPDEFIRKMRLTGLISIRGAGRFIDINHTEDKKIEYILKHYSKYKKYKTERSYFDYMAQVDNELFEIKTKYLSNKKSETLLIHWTKEYKWQQIKD